MSVSQNFPDEGPSLNLNFASSRTLDPRITFTRSSTGTYLDKDGLISVAAANSPRFDHSYDGSNVQSLGLLIEESRTNLLLRSQELATSPWNTIVNTVVGGAGGTGGFTVTNNVTTSPDGTSNASQMNSTIWYSGDSVYQDNTVSGTGTYTPSIFVKGSTCNSITLAAFFTGNSTQGFSFNYNPLTGSIIGTSGGSNHTVVSYPNGWYRIYFTVTGTNALNTTLRFQVYTNTTGITYLWGAQLEAGAFPTSYIPTTTATVTRSADNASMTGTNFSSWYNSTASTGGTVSVQARRGYSGNFSGYPNLYSLNDGTSNNKILAYGVDASNQFTNHPIVTGGVNQTDYVFGALSTTNLFKSIHSFATNSSTFCMNGSLTTTDTSVTLPTVTRLNIGQTDMIGSNLWNGTISSLSYYPTRLTNSQLQNLTK